MVETHVLLENLWILEASLDILEKSQCSLALPNIKYDCAVLFWTQLYWLFIYASKYVFPHKKKIVIDTHTKIGTESTDIVVFRKKLLKFLQGVIATNRLATFYCLLSQKIDVIGGIQSVHGLEQCKNSAKI